MDTNRILAELRSERDRIDRAITAIKGLDSTGQRRVTRAATTTTRPSARGRISAAARRKLSQLMKQRWAAGKMKLPAKAKSAQPPKRRISQAARKKMAAAQRARWAKLKAQQQSTKKTVE